jgi:hypothetical protein
MPAHDLPNRLADPYHVGHIDPDGPHERTTSATEVIPSPWHTAAGRAHDRATRMAPGRPIGRNNEGQTCAVAGVAARAVVCMQRSAQCGH